MVIDRRSRVSAKIWSGMKNGRKLFVEIFCKIANANCLNAYPVWTTTTETTPPIAVSDRPARPAGTKAEIYLQRSAVLTAWYPSQDKKATVASRISASSALPVSLNVNPLGNVT
jgi:hypothetical protein